MRALLLCALVAGCDDLVGFGGGVPPLASLTVEVTGDVDATALRVALVWGRQWLPEARCLTPPESTDAAAVMAAGCRNPFAFTPARVAGSVAVAPHQPAELTLFELPAADVMVGGVTARVAYASLVAFDDRDGSGTLELARPARLPGNQNGPPDDLEDDRTTEDVIHGASFVAMTEPDARVAFREGAFNLGAAFYPRSGCGDPPPAFSIVRAGGFTIEAAIAATAAGKLPEQDPASCAELAPDATTVAIAVRPPDEIREVGCEQRRVDGATRYRQPPEELDLAAHPFACTPIAETDLIDLAVAGAPEDACKGLTHYTLRGCDQANDLACVTPEWDLRETPPAWWPCASEAPQ